MTGTEGAWVPWAMGALGGVGGYMSAGGGEHDKITGFPLKGTNFYAPELYQRHMGDLGTVGAVGAQRAARDINLPSSFIQPLPIIKGPLFADVGVTGMDPALRRPELLSRAGVDWGDNPPFGGEVSGSGVYKTATQENPPSPMLGGGFQEIEDALGLIGVTRDDSGMLTFADNQFYPSSAQLSMQKAKTGVRPSGGSGRTRQGGDQQTDDNTPEG
tara:strand:+ start:2261 stop:2905 length:645 start_codon:yes stop_codon:yes gene_type:complete